MDTYSMLKGHAIPGVVTGKPLEIGGLLGRPEATGRGVMITTRVVLKRMGKSITEVKAAVQGMGNVGSISAKLIAEEGAVIVAVSDASGGVYNPEGLNIPEIIRFLQIRGNRLGDYNAENVQHISNQALLMLDVDVLIPAAMENQITEEIAPHIRAKMIVEGANGPTTVEADKILNDRGITVIPDILANAGGVVVSYFEWVQNIQSLMWSEQDVNSHLNSIMLNAIEDVWNTKQEKKITFRSAAYCVALKKLIAAKKARGIFP